MTRASLIQSACAVLLLVGSLPAFAAIVLPPLQANWDNTKSTKYPAGDKPQEEGTCPPADWTLLARGTASGQICDVDGDFVATVSGQDDEGDTLTVYQSCGTGDCQVIARVPAVSEWLGHQETFTAFMVSISEGTGDEAWYMHAWVTPDGRPRCKAGTPGPDDYNSSGQANQTPVWIAVTRHLDTDLFICHQSQDGSTWSAYGAFVHDTDETLIGEVGGSSHDAAASTTATLEGPVVSDTITVYTPDPPDPPIPPNHAPVCAQIANQSGTQGLAITPIAGSCSDEDEGDTITYSFSGLSGRGLTGNTGTGQITGTPNATALSASPFNIIVTATDQDGAQGQVAFQMTITSSSGNTINWTPAMSNTRTCAQLGAGPGDTVVIQGSVGNNSRTNLVIRDCIGTPSSPITFVNEVSRNGPLLLNGNQSFGLVVENIHYVVISGAGKWSGASAAGCGNYARENLLLPPTEQNCGIRLTGNFQSGVKVRGNSSFFTIQNVSCEAGDNIRSCFALNDHQYSLNGVTQLQCINGTPQQKAACEWREGVKLLYNYANDQHTECFYVGSNANAAQLTDLPLRNNEMGWNYCRKSGWDALSFKSVIDGSTGWSTIHDNYVDIAGESPEPSSDGNGESCVSIFEAGFIEVYNNVCRNPKSAGMNPNTQNRSSAFGTLPLKIYNNFVINASGRCINIGNQQTGDAPLSAEIYNNTCISTDGIVFQSPNTSCIIRDNLVAGTSGAQQTLNGSGICTPTNNRTGTVASQNFVNTGAGNYRLTSDSPARNSGTANCPATDFEGNSRPQQGTCDQGADEYVP